jgi:hypothetical protein
LQPEFFLFLSEFDQEMITRKSHLTIYNSNICWICSKPSIDRLANSKDFVERRSRITWKFEFNDLIIKLGVSKGFVGEIPDHESP